MCRRVVLATAKPVHTRKVRNVRLTRHASRENQLLRSQDDRLPVPLDFDCPLAGRLVVVRALCLGVAPVVQLHDLGVGLEPVSHLVLRSEHWPVVRELEVRHVVVPDWVVQAQ